MVSEEECSNEVKRRTRRSFGVCLSSGSFNKHPSTKFSAIFGNLPSGVNFGAGSFTICCSSSKILIVIAPPCKLTPLLFRLFFFASFSLSFFDALDFGGGRPRGWGLDGERVPSKSERSESSSDTESENGKRPRASSMREMPRDQTSDLTVYCAP